MGFQLSICLLYDKAIVHIFAVEFRCPGLQYNCDMNSVPKTEIISLAKFARLDYIYFVKLDYCETKLEATYDGPNKLFRKSAFLPKHSANLVDYIQANCDVAGFN